MTLVSAKACLRGHLCWHGCTLCCLLQAFEAETRQWLQMPQAVVDAQITAAQADWDLAQSSDIFDHKLVIVWTCNASTYQPGSSYMSFSKGQRVHACMYKPQLFL